MDFTTSTTKNHGVALISEKCKLLPMVMSKHQVKAEGKILEAMASKLRSRFETAL